MDISELKFEIGVQTFQYNRMEYDVEIGEDHTMFWRIGKPGEKYKNMETGCQLTATVEADPMGVLRAAHESSRAWIDHYVESHLAIQEAVVETAAEYGDVAE